MMPLEYNDPQVAVFLRTLAWEIGEAKRTNMSVKQKAEGIVQSARDELGLRKTTGGAPHKFIQDLRKMDLLTKEKSEPAENGWRDSMYSWRLLKMPGHRFVRMLSHDPVYEEYQTGKDGFLQFGVSLRGAAVPRLRVTIGKDRPQHKLLEGTAKGLYFLRIKASEQLPNGALYVGKSDEFEIRWIEHNRKKVFDWWAFVCPEEDNGHISADTLAAAEALLISFWTEICHTANGNRGSDKKPVFAYLQPAVLLVEAASAVLLWLIRENIIKDASLGAWNLPFKDCGARGWPNCYLQPFNSESD